MDLAGRVLGAALLALSFAPWAALEATHVDDGQPHAVATGSAWTLLAPAARFVAAEGLELPIAALTSGWRARVVEMELVCSLWIAYFAAALALVLAPRRWSRARRVFLGAPVALLATLLAMEAANSPVTVPDVWRTSCLATPWIYVPAVVFMAWAWAQLRGSRAAAWVGLVLGGYGLMLVSARLSRRWPEPSWGAGASFAAATLGLIAANLGPSPPPAEEAGA